MSVFRCRACGSKMLEGLDGEPGGCACGAHNSAVDATDDYATADGMSVFDPADEEVDAVDAELELETVTRRLRRLDNGRRRLVRRAA